MVKITKEKFVEYRDFIKKGMKSKSLSRLDFLVYGFIRGKKYREIEPHTHWDDDPHHPPVL